MSLKNINTLYWIFTILFSGLMLVMSWDHILVTDSAEKIIHYWFGFPLYFIPFIGWAKLIGVIGILIPSFRRIKEWAYAGLLFDLIAATYSSIAVTKPYFPLTLMMFIWFVPGILSYIFWHKKMKMMG